MSDELWVMSYGLIVMSTIPEMLLITHHSSLIAGFLRFA